MITLPKAHRAARVEADVPIYHAHSMSNVRMRGDNARGLR